ncbi:hypothetical protein G6K97_17605, partial [Agrobacterium rhizogenes]
DRLADKAIADGRISDAKFWAPGGAGRALLHAVGGGLLGGVNGWDGAVKAALGGATSAMLAPAIEQLVKGMLKGTSLEGTDKGAQVAALLGSILTAGVSGAVGGVDAVAYAVAEYQHNYLTHPELKKFASDLKDCDGDAACEKRVGELYKTLSNQNNKDLLDAIQRRDLAAVMKAVNSDNSAGIREDALISLDPTSNAADIFDNVYWDGAKVDTGLGDTEYFNLYAFMAAKEIMIEQYVSGQRSAGDIAQLMAQYLGNSIYAPKLDVFLATMVAKVDALRSSGETTNVTAKDVEAGGGCTGGLCGSGVKSANLDDLLSSATKRSADEANATFPAGYSPPYTPGTKVAEFVTDGNQTFVRVVSGNQPAGQWIMRASDIEGLSPKQIADLYALPQVPTGITSIRPPAGTRIRTGEVNENFGRPGGGTQFQLLDRVDDGWANVTPFK